MEKIIVFFVPVFTFLFTVFLNVVSIRMKRKHSERKTKLPPGSMGWPYIGETLQLYSQDPNVFFSDREKRYGEIFKTHILGCPCIMLASPEAARLVFVTQAHLFKPTYPKSKENLIGPSALFFHQGEYHMRIRKLVQGTLYPEAIRNLVVDIEAIAVSTTDSWAGDHVINIFHEMKKVCFFHHWRLYIYVLESENCARVTGAEPTPDEPQWPPLLAPPKFVFSLYRAAAQLGSARAHLDSGFVTDLAALNEKEFGMHFSLEVGILSIFGHLEPHYKEELKKNYSILDRGYNSFPTKLPGTPYQKARKARKRLSEILSSITRERKEKRVLEKDLLSCLMNYKDDNGETLNDEQIADNIIGVLFAAQDTTASAMTWILKYLYDNPKVLDAVKAEQKAIYQANRNENSHLTLNQTRNMPFTYKVILESLRMASIISFTFREAVTDVEYKGYLIPKGWKVMPLFRNIHHNPDFFFDPQKFDPSRFEDVVRPNTFMPFGSGVHACPGNELAKLEMHVMIHHLASQFRYEVVGSQGGIEYGPFPIPSHGLPARFWKQESTN